MAKTYAERREYQNNYLAQKSLNDYPQEYPLDNQTVKVRSGKSLPRLRRGSLPFTRPRAATPSELLGPVPF